MKTGYRCTLYPAATHPDTKECVYIARVCACGGIASKPRRAREGGYNEWAIDSKRLKASLEGRSRGIGVSRPGGRSRGSGGCCRMSPRDEVGERGERLDGWKAVIERRPRSKRLPARRASRPTRGQRRKAGRFQRGEPRSAVRASMRVDQTLTQRASASQLLRCEEGRSRSRKPVNRESRARPGADGAGAGQGTGVLT